MKTIKNRSFRSGATVLLIGGMIYYASAFAFNSANTHFFWVGGATECVSTLDDSGSMDSKFSTLTNLGKPIIMTRIVVKSYHELVSSSGKYWMGVVDGMITTHSNITF